MVAALISAACASDPIPVARPLEATVYRVAPPDVLSIGIGSTSEPEIRRDVAVRPDGRISFDLIGDVEVEGKTIQEIRADIRDRAARFYVDPAVAVSLVSSESRRIYILGQVRAPGAYSLVGRVTAIEALARAGDANPLADPNAARLIRPSPEGRAVYPVHYEDIVTGVDDSTNYELEPGDMIYVPPRTAAGIGLLLQALLFPLRQITGLGSPAVDGPL
jgi:polysaccharide export outer membrane protein